MKKFKKILAIVLSIAMVLGMSSASYAEGEENSYQVSVAKEKPDGNSKISTYSGVIESAIVVTDEVVLDGEAGFGSFIGRYSAKGADEYKYFGYAITKSVPSSYKYLKLRYTGDITTLRLEFSIEGNINEDIIWFNNTKASHFETVDGSDIVLKATSETECIIDLEASGIDIGRYAGFHMHYLEPYNERGEFTIVDARLMKGNIIQYYVDEYDNIVITGCEPNSEELVIPEVIDGKFVKVIDNEAFKNHTNLKRVAIPDSVTTIGENVFAGCTNLTIYGYRNSVAHQYAIDNNIEFEPLDSVKYTTHVQSYGWENDWAADGAISGTEGEAKRLEAIKIKLDNTTVSGGIEYRTHVQSYGWESDWAADGEVSGTSGEAKRLEAIQIRLTGEMAEKYDVYYRVHAQSYGWLGWAKNGASAGTSGYAKRLEAIEIVLVEKGGAAPGSIANAYIGKPANINYCTHVQSYGWENTWAKNGEMSGTEGQAKRLEAIQIKLDGQSYAGTVSYRTHVQSYGWLNWTGNGETSGTEGQAKRLEAIQITLNGEIAEYFDIYYRVHAQTYGWLGWAKNGQPAGTAGLAKRLEAIEILLVKKGEAAPGSTSGAFILK